MGLFGSLKANKSIDILIEPEAMITDIIPLSDIDKNGFDVLNHDKDRAIKILVAPELG